MTSASKDFETLPPVADLGEVVAFGCDPVKMEDGDLRSDIMSAIEAVKGAADEASLEEAWRAVLDATMAKDLPSTQKAAIICEVAASRSAD